MKRTGRLLWGLTLSLLFVGGHVSSALAERPDPAAFLQAQIRSIRALLASPVESGSLEARALDTRLRAMIEASMELDRLGEKTLGRHWAALSVDQRKVLVEILRDLFYRSHLKRVRSAHEQYELAFGGERSAPEATSARVAVIARTRSSETELVFVMEARDGKDWLVTDVLIDEVSLIRNYRDQFNEIITTDGYPALLETLKQKQAEL